MSAWIVSKAHIDALVQAMATEGMISYRDADKTGALLWHECHKSVNARYDENTPTPEYRFEGIEAPLDTYALWMLTQCYDYQSCEHDGWDTSKAKELSNELETRLLVRLGLRENEAWEDPRHTTAPWGIDALTQIIAATAPAK